MSTAHNGMLNGSGDGHPGFIVMRPRISIEAPPIDSPIIERTGQIRVRNVLVDIWGGIFVSPGVIDRVLRVRSGSYVHLLIEHEITPVSRRTYNPDANKRKATARHLITFDQLLELVERVAPERQEESQDQAQEPEEILPLLGDVDNREPDTAALVVEAVKPLLKQNEALHQEVANLTAKLDELIKLWR